MVVKSIHKKYGGRQRVITKDPTYETPKVYMYYLKFKDENITLNDSTLEEYKILMRMSCEEIDLGFAEPDRETGKMIYKLNGQPVLEYIHNYNTDNIIYFINNKYIKWNSIKVKVSSNAELMYAVKLDNGEVIIVLYIIKVRFAKPIYESLMQW